MPNTAPRPRTQVEVIVLKEKLHPLFTGTQPHNDTPDKARFLESADFEPIIPAREGFQVERGMEFHNGDGLSAFSTTGEISGAQGEPRGRCLSGRWLRPSGDRYPQPGKPFSTKQDRFP